MYNYTSTKSTSQHYFMSARMPAGTNADTCWLFITVMGNNPCKDEGRDSDIEGKACQLPPRKGEKEWGGGAGRETWERTGN